MRISGLLFLAALSIVAALVSVLNYSDKAGVALGADDDGAPPLLDAITCSEAWVDDDYFDVGDNDGHTWGFDAFNKIQDGIDAVSGSTVHVADGTYYEHIVLKDGVQVLGNGSDTTIIDGMRSGSVITGTNLDNTTRFEGFTITNGSATNGGGFNLGNANIVVSNCTISENIASSGGGGMYTNNCSLTISNCIFDVNQAKSGGAMRNYKSSPAIVSCAFNSNPSATQGGGIVNDRSSPVIANCVFLNNSACNNGGGIYNTAYSSPNIVNCIFWNNSASGDGESMYSTSSCTPILANSII